MNGLTSTLSKSARLKAVLFLAIAGSILWIPVAALLLGNTPHFLRDLGFLSGPRGTPLAWIMGIIVAIVYAGYTVRNNPFVREHWRALSLLKLLGIIAAVGAAIVEEAFFRRLLMDYLMHAGWSNVFQVIMTGVVFGLAHGIWGIATGRFYIGFGVTIATGLLGVALGIVYLLGERSLAPVIVSHFIITATIQPGIMFSVFSGRKPKSSIINGA